MTSCQDAEHAFQLRQSGMETLVVADPSATAKLRQAALLFYRCAQRDLQDTYSHQMFLAYYANTLEKVGESANDPRALSLAQETALRLNASAIDDVRPLIASIHIPSNSTHATLPSPEATATPASFAHSDAFCKQLEPLAIDTLNSLERSVGSSIDAGTNDTQVLATTSRTHGSAFKDVEDDYNRSYSELQAAAQTGDAAHNLGNQLNDQEREMLESYYQDLVQTVRFIATYNRLALTFERTVNGTNRQIAAAQITQVLGMLSKDTSTTYTNGSANCSSYSASVSCYGSSYSTTTYNNSATIAQQNAANELAAAQAGRLSLPDADNVLIQGLQVLNQIESNANTERNAWIGACSGA